jgi:prevent-host-death family protein
MKTVGLRELKNNLSAYVGAARKGETVVVTDRGEPVAQLTRPASSKTQPQPLEEMARRGGAILGKPLTAREREWLYRDRSAVVREVTSTELLDSERGERG